MEIEIGKFITGLGAAVAAVTGIWNVWWQTRGKHDRFMIGLGAVTPTIEKETVIYVVSLSDHPIILKDWGFIEPDGKFNSLPYAGEAGELRDEETVSRGNSKLGDRSATFEMGYERKQQPLGAYAISVTQKRPRLYFDDIVPHWQKTWIRLRLWLQPNYFAW